MRTKAVVIQKNGQNATVEVERASACEGCHKKDSENGCSVCTLMGGDRSFRADADNRIGASVGDTVWIETPTSRVMLYAALVFLAPLLAAVIGWCVARIFTVQTPFLLLGAVAGFVLAFVCLHVYSSLLRKKQPDAVITEILSFSASEQSKPENNDAFDLSEAELAQAENEALDGSDPNE